MTGTPASGLRARLGLVGRGRASRLLGRGQLAVVLTVLLGASGCGKKGPPLPPFVRVPAAPAAVQAERRGAEVDVRLTLPSANADGSRPANIRRVEVFAVTGPAPASETAVLQDGVRVGSVDVKSPRDPNITVDPDEPDSDIEPLQGPGLDQGAVAHVRERLTGDMLANGEALVRTYVGVGITVRGRRGLVSPAVAVPLGAAPGTLSAPTVTYDDVAVTVSWEGAPGQGGGGGGEREAEPLEYWVYDVSPPPSGAAPEPSAAGPPETRLNAEPIADTTYADPRITWNVERCYIVRAVRQIERLRVEGDASPARCVTLTDTFPPATPTGVTAVASEGAINLIWTPSPSTDLAGYRVLRAELPASDMQSITPGLLTQTTFSDSVRAGARYVYAVQAVDAAGNASQSSAPVEETAR